MTEGGQSSQPPSSRFGSLRSHGSATPTPLYPPRGGGEGWGQRPSGSWRLGLGGGVSSGKTLFPGALKVAVNAAGANARGHGLRIIAVNDAATSHMSEATDALGRMGNLPPATVDASELRWVFSGKLTNPRMSERHLRYPGWLSRTVRFELDLREPPGEDYGQEYPASGPRVPTINESVAALARSDGIIFLFDPVAEAEHRYSAKFFADTLAMLNTMSVRDGRSAGRYLPQRLAVCVTKFDDDRVFHRAAAAGLVFGDAKGTLRVPDRLAAEFFEFICKDTGQANGLHLLEAVRNNFRPRSVRYFVTSAVGFSAASAGDMTGGPILRRDPNIQGSGQGGPQQVREQARPINVLEPLLYLVRNVRRGRALQEMRERMTADRPGP